MGDTLLIEVARRLSLCVRTEDTVARLGGDEFTIILSKIKNARDAADVAQKIIAVINKPFLLCEHEVSIGVSIGISIYPIDDLDLDNLIKKADIALYHVKNNDRNHYQFFTEEINIAMSKNLAITNNLRHALANNESFLLFQPVVNIQTRLIEGVEALVRWQHNGNAVYPNDFIPLAEETGLIIPIGEWILRTACQQGKIWQAEGLFLRIAVNISIRQLRQVNFIKSITDILQETGFDPHYLEFELTESIFIKNIEETIAVCRLINDLGITLSIDDFGTGYSSLNYLHRLPIDVLKIDRSFVQGVDTMGTTLNIIRAIIGMAHGLGLNIIAEGIENMTQYNFLSNQKCDFFQGYLCSPPITSANLKQLLSALRSRTLARSGSPSRRWTRAA